MAKSLRSKWKRKMRAVKRVRYGEKEAARLEKMLKESQDKKAFINSDLVVAKSPKITEKTEAKDPAEEAMDIEAGGFKKFSAKTLKDEHGTYPKWMPKRKIQKAKQQGKKKPDPVSGRVSKRKQPTKQKSKFR